MKFVTAIVLVLVLVVCYKIYTEQGSIYGMYARQRIQLSSLYRDAYHLAFGNTRFETLNDDSIQCWGDSLTSGFNISWRLDYPAILSVNYKRPTINFGRPKETSEQIKERFFNRRRFDGPENVVIWAGRNDSGFPDQVINNVDAMVRSLNPRSKFFVLGLLPAAVSTEFSGTEHHDKIDMINQKFKEKYGSRYIPILDLLIEHANPRFEEDTKNAQMHVVPRSLRSDGLHLNDVGAAIVAYEVNRAMIRNAW